MDRDRIMRMFGLGAETSIQLDQRFADADQDLIADAPTDTAALRDPATLRFCFLSDAAGAVDPAAWTPLLDAIGQATGKPVEYVVFSDVDQQLAALRDGELDVTFINTGNVPRAVNTAGFVPTAGTAIGGQLATYHMLFIAGADTGIDNVQDLDGRQIAFTSIGSNSGYKAPLVILYKDFGLQPEVNFTWAYTGNHETSIKHIAQGKYPAAAVASDLFEAAVASGAIDSSKVKEIYRSEPFPRVCLGTAHDLKPELAEAITRAVIGFSTSGSPLQHQLSGSDGFVPLSYKNQFALVRRIDDTVGFKHEI